MLVVVLVVVLVAGLCVFSYARVWQINRDYPPKGAFVSVSGLDLHYLRRGTGQPVVLLHGRDGALQEYTLSIFDQLAEEYDVIAFDRPGYGHSGWPENEALSLDVQAALIQQALAELNISKPLLVGHSYGGAVALRYLLDFQEEVHGTVLLAPTSFMDQPPDGAMFLIPTIPVLGPLLTHTLLLPVGTRLARRIYERAFYPEPPPQEYVDTMAALYLRPANFAATAGELSAMQESLQALSEEYNRITTPVTIVFGTADQMVDFEQDGQRLAEELADGTLIRVDGAGHKLHHTHPEIVIRAISAAVEGQER